MNWTAQMVAAHNAKVAGTALAPKVLDSAKLNLKLRSCTELTKLNKTETEFLRTILEPWRPDWIGVQAITLKLADDMRYTPDFWKLSDGLLTAYEVKGGFMREDSFLKLKMAARLFPFFQFVLAQKKKGSWSLNHIKP